MTVKATLADDTLRTQLLSLGTLVVTDADQGYEKHFRQAITIVNRDKNVTVEVGYAQDGKVYLFTEMLNATTNIITECEKLIKNKRYGIINSFAVFTMLELFSSNDNDLTHAVSMKTEDYGIYANITDLNKVSAVLDNLDVPEGFASVLA